MAATCRVCVHASRSSIDEALVGGVSMRSVAREHGLSKDSVRRHADGHLPAALAAVAMQERELALPLLAQVRELQAEALAILASAKADGRAGVALSAIREASRLVELAGKITGELDERPTVNVLNLVQSPDWQQLRARLLDALAPFPDVRGVVASRLMELEGS